MQEDLIKRLRELPEKDFADERDFAAAVRQTMREAADVIEKLASADVRPVVRGKWIDDKDNLVPWDELNKNCPSGSAFCSVCGEWLTASDEYPAIGNFCPNCGADMREEN